MTPSLPRVTRTGAAALPYPAYDDDDDAPLLAGLGAAATARDFPRAAFSGSYWSGSCISCFFATCVGAPTGVAAMFLADGTVSSKPLLPAATGSNRPRGGGTGWPNDWLDPNEPDWLGAARPRDAFSGSH